jgi:tetratricopeptide (TPR) repeat protein
MSSALFVFGNLRYSHHMNKILIILFGIILALTRQSFSDSYPLWGNLKPGPNAVGFKVKLQYDHSRTFRTKKNFEGKPQTGPRARPIQTLVWYPAKKSSNSKPMIFEEYVNLLANELNFDPPNANAKQQSVQRYIQQRAGAFQVSDNGTRRLLSMQTAAIRDAPPQEGKFPLLIYAPGSSGTAFENSVFCEYMASNGYIVAALPSMGAYARNASVDLTGFYAYMQDIEFVIGSMHDFPNVDPDRLAIAGFSMGGSAATLVQMRNTDIDAVVYFDTGIVFDIVDSWFGPSNYYDVNSLRAPQLYLTRSDSPGINTNFVDRIHYADTYSIMFDEGHRHADFISEGIFAGLIPGYLTQDPPKDPKVLFETVCTYAHHFLDGYLMKDPSQLKYLEQKPEDNALAANYFTIEVKKAGEAPPRDFELASMVREQSSVDQLRQIFEKAKKNADVPVFRETTVNQLGYEFLFQGNSELAVQLFELNVQAFPKSANAYDSLSEAYDRAGKKDRAIESVRKALELLPNDASINDQRRELIRRGAEDRLKKLQS